MLFFTGWYQPWVALPLSAATLIAILCYSIALYRGNEGWSPTGKDWLHIIISTFIVLAYLIVSGQAGFFPPPGDFVIFRQALYENIAHAPWPVILPNGKEMTYYIAGLLPAAMTERIMPEGLSQWPILFHTFVPSLLVLLIFARRWKALPLLFICMFIALQDPLSMLFHPTSLIGGGEGIMVRLLNSLHEATGIDLRVWCTYYGNKTIVASLRHCACQYNSATFTVLATALLLNTRQRSLYPLIVALLFPISPLGAIAMLPIASYLYLKTWDKRVSTLLNPCIIPMAAVLACLPYFFRADEGITIIASGLSIYGAESLAAFLRYLLGLAVLFLPLWKTRRQDGLYWATLLSAVALFTLFVGTPRWEGFHGLNELTMKGSAVITIILACFYIEDWQKLNRPFRYALAAWLIAVSATSQLGQLSRFDPTRGIEDDWNGHLNHDRPFLQQSVPSIRPCSADIILLKQSGEAESCFPGNILPKAPGCDYSRPPRKG